MVQYDPFATLLVATDLPTRPKSIENGSGHTTPSLVDSPTSINSIANVNLCTAPSCLQDPFSKKEISPPHMQSEERHSVVHPRLRRLSSSHGSSNHYCSSCHMRRSSQELLFKNKHDHSPEEESWDGFCPDIAMPRHESPRPSIHHARRHSGLCPEGLISQDQDGSTSLAPQILSKPRPCRHNSMGYHHQCHCETVTPTDNLTERYGMVEEPADLEINRRRSLEKEASAEVAEIMHEELLADMEAKQWRM